MINIGFKRLTDDAIIPTKAHATDSGFDLFANEAVIIEPGETKLIKTGIAILLPPEYEAQVRPRSGITSKTKLRVQLGTIDNLYTGEVGIIVDNIAHFEGTDFLAESIDGEINTSQSYNTRQPAYYIRRGDKLAQLVIARVPIIQTYEIDNLPVTERGANGFGSSGY